MSTTAAAPTTDTPLEWQPLWDAMRANPDQWIPTTESMHNEMLNVLPPRCGGWSFFLVGEEHHSCPRTGEAKYAAFRLLHGRHVARYLTVREWHQLRGQ